MKIEWDVEKAKSNIQKHGISFEQASYVFTDPFSLSRYDEAHSDSEDRWILLGKSLSEVILTVVHTFTDEAGVEFVRVISARKATKAEQQTYQKRCPK
ncbi:MAG: BrnT family toxin [Psychrosphaera sp.]|nr:BrnT family toxin [Psychrosphaera sp.]